ncbi:MAG: hypothetical protein JNM18_02795, partial [Planctomycetaceae bacterium]|nr:hypothetical protein [Planctomycetaceae bacterium]
MKIESREYKVIVDVALFADFDAALAEMSADLQGLVESLEFSLDGEFDIDEREEQSIRFLDTRDFTLRRNSLLLRQRIKLKNDKTEYTLKCRTADRYFSALRNLEPAQGLKADHKFEEDIGAPFVSGFSQSTTVKLKPDDSFAGDSWPRTLAEGSQLFPLLSETECDGLRCSGDTPLAVVNGR